MSKDYYSVLGLDRSAQEADIKKAYREMSKKWHPDKHKGDKEAETKFKEINEAYEVLGNAKRRQQYDTFGSAGGPSGGGQGFSGFDFSGFQQGDMGDLGDIFSSFFGGRGRQRQRNRGSDLQVRIGIDLADVLNGTKKTIAIEKYVLCNECGGSGAKGGSLKQCGECGGTGQITRTAQSFFGTVQQSVMCPTCDGSGSIPETPCGNCDGEGRKREKAQITIDVPAGIDDGQTLRVTGQGEAGKHSEPAGDLFVVVQVSGDPRFNRDGTDIRSHITIPVVDAILGTEVSVPTLHGDITLKIPAGTQPGQVMRLKSKGVPALNSSRLGDHFVTVRIEIPKKLSRKEKKIMEEWKDAS